MGGEQLYFDDGTPIFPGRDGCRKFILAGSMQQARDYCKAKGIEYKPENILHAPHCLFGVPRGTTVVMVGTFYDRSDFHAMTDIMLERQCKTETDLY